MKTLTFLFLFVSFIFAGDDPCKGKAEGKEEEEKRGQVIMII